MKKLGKLELYIGAVILAIQTVVMAIEIVRRYIFSKSLIWSEELVRYLFIWFIFLGAAYCVTSKQHITVDFLAQMLPKKIAYWMEGFTTLVWIALSAWVTYLTAMFTLNGFQTGNKSTALHIPMWLIYLAMPVGFCIMTIRLILLFHREYIRGEGKPAAETDTPQEDS